MRTFPLGKGNIKVKIWRRAIRCESGTSLSRKKKVAIGDRLAQDGIVIIRGFIPTRKVLQGRNKILRLGNFNLKARKPWPSLLSALHIQNDASVRRVLESPRLALLMRELLGGPVLTTRYKWLRAMPPKLFTGAHTDAAYFGESSSLLTAWIPFTKVPVHRGLVWVPGSHSTSQWTKKRVGKDGTESGWIVDDASQLKLPRGFNWHGTSLNPGDVAIFGTSILHMTLPNESSLFRISCDTRWATGDPSSQGTGPWSRVD